MGLNIREGIQRYWLKAVGATVALGVLGFGNTIAQAEMYQDGGFELNEGGSRFSLVGRDTVRQEEGSGPCYFFDFGKKVVVSGLTENVRYGGAGFGGMIKFEDFDQGAIERARQAGLQIAADIQAHNPSLFHDVSYVDYMARHQANATNFVEEYTND